MMVIAVGLSSYNIALFHLVNHAFYKALLFLGAGAVIHAVSDNQDFRKYGGLRSYLPLTYSVMLIASLSLVAFPFMTGFYSKDFILESAYGQFYFSGTVVYFIATIGAMFTTLYSVKVLYLTFLTNPNGPVVNYKNAHEGDIFMSLPLIILAIFSIFFGYITKDLFIGLGSAFFADNSLFIHPIHEIMLDTEFAVPTLFKLLPLFFTISLSVIAIILSEFTPKIILHFKFYRLGYNIFGFFNQRFLMELFYNKYITGLVLNLGGQTTKALDKGSVELLGPFGLEKGLNNLSVNIASLDKGVITSYALYIVIGLILYLLLGFLSGFDYYLFLLLLILLTLFSNKVDFASSPISTYNNLNSNMSSLLHAVPNTIAFVKKVNYTDIDNKSFSTTIVLNVGSDKRITKSINERCNNAAEAKYAVEDSIRDNDGEKDARLEQEWKDADLKDEVYSEMSQNMPPGSRNYTETEVRSEVRGFFLAYRKIAPPKHKEVIDKELQTLDEQPEITAYTEPPKPPKPEVPKPPKPEVPLFGAGPSGSGNKPGNDPGSGNKPGSVDGPDDNDIWD